MSKVNIIYVVQFKCLTCCNTWVEGFGKGFCVESGIGSKVATVFATNNPKEKSDKTCPICLSSSIKVLSRTPINNIFRATALPVPQPEEKEVPLMPDGRCPKCSGTLVENEQTIECRNGDFIFQKPVAEETTPEEEPEDAKV